MQLFFQGHPNLIDSTQLLDDSLFFNGEPWVSGAASKPFCVIKQSSDEIEVDELNNPFVILTKEDIFLVQRPLTANMQRPRNHVISMRRPLHPGEWMLSLAPQDRHSFFSHIPELGVFIIGSPIGRAAVFSLYWTHDEGNPHRRYGFKLEYLLPFKEEHENEIAGGSRERLIGVAVAPIQGMFDESEEMARTGEQGVQQPRRWRLIMYYMDHNLLSYELSKPREREWPDPRAVVV